ncbi:MAG: hypothetical protein H0V82_06075 [Candidatus Protochlamydia sp.]|nr:hypothetical protein [Candidatus Protochlamydia sp.]
MTLPILIIFERHWDEAPKQLLNELIPKLSYEGYNTFCVEAGSERSENDIISNFYIELERTSKLNFQALQYLEKRGIGLKGRLSDLSYEDLSELMRLHVSSQRFLEVAEKIKHLPALLLYKDTLNLAFKHFYNLTGVDNGKDLDAILSANMEEKHNQIIQRELSRIQSQADRLFELYQKKKGVIFLDGALHSKKLIAKLKEKGLKENDLIYYFPHSSQHYSRTVNDFEAMGEESIPDINFCLSSNKDFKVFSQKIITEIQLKNKNYLEEITEGSYASKYLTKFFAAPFKAFLRHGYYVDALLLKDSTSSIERITKILHEKNISSETLCLNEKEYLLIRNINTKEVSDMVHKLSTL